MLVNDAPPVMPLWINGHAFLTLTAVFHDVRNTQSDAPLRRTPLCGPDEVRIAVTAAQAALASWMRMSEDARIALFSALGVALATYAEHFARLINEESGNDLSRCVNEVGETVELLRNARVGEGNGVVAVIGNRGTPLLGALQLAVPALAAGSVVVIRPSAETPSALFALAELTARCGFPDGVFNIVYGDEMELDSLRSNPDLRLLHS